MRSNPIVTTTTFRGQVQCLSHRYKVWSPVYTQLNKAVWYRTSRYTEESLIYTKAFTSYLLHYNSQAENVLKCSYQTYKHFAVGDQGELGLGLETLAAFPCALLDLDRANEM